MKILKKIIIALLVIIALILLVLLFMPSKRHMEESINIKGPAKNIYEQVITMKKWEKWMPFSEEDPEMKIFYEGAPKGVGAIMKWESKKQGNGSMTIEEAEAYKKIKLKLEFEGQGISHSDFLFTETGESTDVVWSLDIENLKYPIGRLIGIFMPGTIHKSFHNGLVTLKKVSEEYTSALGIFKTSEVSIKKMEKQHALYIRDSSRIDEIDMIIGKLFGELYQYLGMNRIECTAPPFVRYLVWDEKANKNVMEAGVFIKEPVKGNDRVKYQEIPVQNYVRAIHTGAYESVHNTHMVIDKYIIDNKLTLTGAPMEIYITDPEKEPDITKWETEVLYPIK
ncbi:MAG TPA: GyrI-like domain-containing protein [Bacteroidales bacterium]|mgnify:CR=1 FL=1|nr:GyrI-like domain-containing protein [Bacteroidales bacterium]HQI70418.1 GyrI-like domain-containing protein [Bacteroidales bacterium]